MTNASASWEAKYKDATSENAGLASRGKDREAELSAAVKRYTSCEARIAQEWAGQEACAKHKEASESCAASKAVVAKQLSAAEGDLTKSKAAAVGKAAAEERASACATEKQQAVDQGTRLSAAKEAAEAEAAKLRESAQAASLEAGKASEQASLLQSKHKASAAGALAQSKRVGVLEVELAEASQANASCADALKRSGPVIGLGAAVKQLLASDATAALAYGRAYSAAAQAAWRDETESKVAALSRRLGAVWLPDAVIDVPVGVRAAFYLLLLLAVLGVRAALLLRRGTRELAASEAQVAALTERVETMQEVLAALKKGNGVK